MSSFSDAILYFFCQTPCSSLAYIYRYPRFLGNDHLATVPWWVCAVYPGGDIPKEPGDGGGRLRAKDVLAAYFDDALPTAGATTTTIGIGTLNKGAPPRYAVHNVFGISCTATAHVASAVTAMSDALAEKTGVARGSSDSSEQ